ncbi:TRAP transporter permease DctM/Q [Thermus scotoductus]|uniref:TRAP transporter permease DctM/Q n=1 Tax=Thermus scotoductus TaxID=37636 RepID=A0A430UXW4_THESC|nr:TRAP transporter large permease subunit [Thermus scotoductus]RTH05259.1 TRAP transporter permease DctM/Q [Thermus scotoductus]RTH98740.1 TRAP transporter permease DctM/Q [Thermus scotoductus]RTI14291.1 TRAP transporter permease DctM/Q [Thermus scotoductus]
MPIETLTWLMFGSLFLLLFTGYPLAFLIGGVAVTFIAWLWSPDALALVPQRMWNNMTQYLLAAIPLFIFMASMLEKSGLIEEIFDVAYKWLGRVPGGLAVATVAASTVLAAMVGVIGAAVVTMALVALPAMLRRGYSPVLAAGTVMAGGTLGILIPPSVLAIIYGLVANQSVGELYLGSVLPGLVLSGLYMLFSVVYALLYPQAAPRIPKEEMPTWAERWRALRAIWAPLLLIFLVLGTIFLGLAAPTEAAAVGAFGAMLVAALHRKLTWQNLRLALEQTAKATAMVLWIIFGANAFVAFYVAQGGDRFVSELLLGTGLSPWGILIVMQIILIILGMFLDWVGILLLAVPVFVPIIRSLGFDPLWFGVLYLINMQMSFLSPPFGYALFYVRGVAPQIPMGTIYRAAIPFLLLQLTGLILVMLFPGLATWLPSLVYGK